MSNYAQVNNNLFVGDIKSAADLQFVASKNINTIVNLSGKSLELIEDVEYYNYTLPNHELMCSEMPKTKAKINKILSDLINYGVFNQNVLICCFDGKNKCMLLVGYYLILHCARPADVVITELEQIYFTPQQKQDEQNVNELDIVDQHFDQAINNKREERNNIRCLTNISFKKLLRGSIHEKIESDIY